MAEDQPEAPFNMAMMYYISLNKLLDIKDEYAAMGNLEQWYSSLRAVFRHIIFQLNVKERAALNSEFEEIAELLRKRGGGSARLQADMNYHVSSIVSPLLDALDIRLWDVMYKYKMIFPKIDTGAGLSNVMKRYGLEPPSKKRGKK